MKRLLFIACLCNPAISFAGEKDDATKTPPPLAFPHAPRAWLGLEVTKPDESITAQLPSLPPGIGFVVRSLEKGGPAEAAGLQDFDVLWKMGDQMLVNEGQLAALLRLSKPGDEIAISGFRAGQALEVKLKLGEAPVRKHPFPDDMVDDTILPRDCRGPTRVTNISLPDRRASFSTDEGNAEVRKEGDVYKVKIIGPKDELIFEGDFAKEGEQNSIPERWKRRVYALRRGLDHALEGSMTPTRQPRPRVVPPPEGKS